MCPAQATICCERSRHVGLGRDGGAAPPGRATWHNECCVAISMRCFSLKKADVIAGLFLLLCAPASAHASFLSPEAEDKLATIIALAVLFIVPVVLITVFWLVHILPEKIAHKRHHPQFEAIRTLCLLSLVFGGLLWPLAWIWAYTKPALYKLAYGTDRPVDMLDSSSVPASELMMLRAKLEALEAKLVRDEVH
jgi:CBS domain containing-hemolysin-like protein